MLKSLVPAITLLFVALSTTLSAFASVVTTVGYEKSNLLDVEGTNVSLGLEKSNLRVSGTALIDSKGTAVTYGMKTNVVIPVKRIEFTPGIGLDWYNNHTVGNKTDMNFNVGIDYKLTEHILLGTTYKAVLANGKYSSDAYSVQGNVTVKW